MIEALFCMEVRMEKYLKNLSIAFMILEGMFFLNMFGLAMAEQINIPEFVLNVIVIGANVLLYLVPILFMVIFGIGMASIFKRVFAQYRIVTSKSDKFPTLWFVLASIGFLGFYIFVTLVFS